MKILYRAGTGELVQKKSRFIADTCPVHSEEEAQEFLAGIRKKYWDARHHCYAWVIGERNEQSRCSDDGEPQGTAGRPMLDVLLGQEVHDAMVVVTRYFGGVLLGTGGLVRAYSGAAAEGLRQSVILTKTRGMKLTIRTDYNGIGKIQYLLAKRAIFTQDARYTDAVELDVLVKESELQSLKAELTEGTNGRVQFPSQESLCYALHGEEVIVLEGGHTQS